MYAAIASVCRICLYLLAKRAETRECPVCCEKIPIRLLGKHAEFEYRRVEEILHGDYPDVNIGVGDAG